ncbi:hypothetical protein C0993_007387 [Termitomyces sp. T159_Od127]|nr:hypothetical protein C0993_007387 [Termitomyces sp. T159_Od127]
MTARFSKAGTTTNATKTLLADIKAAPENSKKIKIVASLWLNKKTKGNSMKFTPSTTKALRLNDKLTSQGTVEDLFKEFQEQGWISKASKEKKEIEIRVVCNQSDMYLDDVYNVDESSPRQSSLKSQVPKASEARLSSKCKLSHASEAEAQDSAARHVRQSAWRDISDMSSQRCESAARHIRQSAWPKLLKAKVYTWNLEMIQCSFKRRTASIDGPVISWNDSDKIEVIQIPRNWIDGHKKAKAHQDFKGSGYIGSGSAKQVIYARFNGQEYALGQGLPGFDDVENQKMLQAEFANLVYGEAFRNTFEDMGIATGTVIPRFQFNLENAILGTFILDDNAQAPPAGLLYQDFIATSLLPTSPIDAPVKKFTSNHDTGLAPAPGDPMTMALHAFTHYMIIISQSQLVLCDLQGKDGFCFSIDVGYLNLITHLGTYNKDGIMTLIDPQSHLSEVDKDKRLYWDEGPIAIERILTRHLEDCDQNIICTGLDLRHLTQSDSTIEDSQWGSSPYRSKSVRRKHFKKTIGSDSDEPVIVDGPRNVSASASSSHSSLRGLNKFSRPQHHDHSGPLRTGWYC